MYKCRKCKAVVNSKCIHQRSYFPMDDLDDKERPVSTAMMLRNIMEWQEQEEAYPKGSMGYIQGLKKRTLSLTWHFPPGDTPEERLIGVLKSIRSLSDKVMEMYACDHDFYIMAGEVCDFGCCRGRKSHAKKKKVA